MARSANAWWPGGRLTTKARPEPGSTRASMATRPAPADSRAAVHDAAVAYVSGSRAPPPAAQNRSSSSRYWAEWTRSSWVRSAGPGRQHHQIAVEVEIVDAAHGRPDAGRSSGWPCR